MLIEQYNRKIDYLRISVTDRCNLRCVYCMPDEGVVNEPHERLLTFEEIARVVRILSSLGIKKLRLTGGEPLVRKGIINLIEALAKINGIEEIALTTNGILLADYVEQLKQAGVSRLNVSLDTLSETKFKEITRGESLRNVLKGIEKAKEAGFGELKLNVVVMKGINDNEIIDFVEFALKEGLILRFIEFMKITPLWREDCFLPQEEIKNICAERFSLEKINWHSWGPAQYYKARNGIIGFIRTTTENCASCSRLRLTSTGEFKICLYENNGFSLRNLLRSPAVDTEIRNVIKTKIGLKSEVNFRNYEAERLYMCAVGG